MARGTTNMLLLLLLVKQPFAGLSALLAGAACTPDRQGVSAAATSCSTGCCNMLHVIVCCMIRPAVFVACHVYVAVASL
jgi:hypothetical protein